ncbi:cell division protein FtsL [Alkalilimnicola ehrlichii MLHE-1]|uniref:Cell division protein FtsL n=1 Tax=Alkalilimnicola ehrlichii (strain ATCC BAA-1101 / DSM 17681 / MLHE-1) TaxID=187272 RepID=Q0A6J5_ALKEH|nr:cell division protein FtsL [Alkalilimnicola ehrlichii]ABI57542.1 cell division protein FtsL [Alkalilimnicola ehrlichii MLHE-1]
MSRGMAIALCLGLVVAVLGSALGVVASKHQHRSLFMELQGLSAEADHLNVEWGMLQLEQGTWAGHGRVERVGRERLGMVMPGREDIVIIRP